jgi:hypothetical protein
LELLLKLYKKDVITNPRALFEVSQQQKIDGLIAQGVFEFVPYNQSYITEFGEIDRVQMISVLNNYLIYHLFTRDSKLEPRDTG